MKRIVLFLFALTLLVGANAGNQPVTGNLDSTNEVEMLNPDKLPISVKDSIMMSKLSADQIMKLEEERLNIERERAEAESREDMPLNGLGIVLISLAPFIFVGIVIFLSIKNKNRESERRYELYKKSLEMGQAIPEHFFDEPKKTGNASNLKRGILWFVVGVALLISFLIMHKESALIVGIVPTFVGIGYLLVHFLDKPKTDSTLTKDEQHG